MFLHKIRVSGKGIKEFIAHSWTKEKLYLAYHLKDILEKGEEQEKQELKHPRSDGIKHFIPLKTQVKIDGKNRLVRSFIAVDKNGNIFYDLFINIPAKLNDPEKESGSNKASIDNNILQTNNSVNQVLNLFIDGEAESKNNNSKLPLTYYDYFRLVYLKSHDYKEFLRQVDLYEVKVKNLSFKDQDHHRDEEGKFSEKEEGSSLPQEAQDKINSVNIDFSKDNILPELNKKEVDILKSLGIDTTNKKVLFKKPTIERNKTKHRDVLKEDYDKYIGKCLYSPEVVLRGNKDKPYFNIITRIKDDKNSVVLLDVDINKDNLEIVHFHLLRDKARKTLESKNT